VDGDRAIKLSEREERLISIPSIICQFLAKKLAFQKRKNAPRSLSLASVNASSQLWRFSALLNATDNVSVPSLQKSSIR
jgi:hypothetical protein